MRIMWLSNSPWTPSGYGQQSKLFLERLQADGHQMAATCFYGLEGGVINMGGVVCYPKFRHIYGNDIVVPHSQNFKADVMISLMDVWVMNPEEYPLGFKWVPWYPVDHETHARDRTAETCAVMEKNRHEQVWGGGNTQGGIRVYVCSSRRGYKDIQAGR